MDVAGFVLGSVENDQSENLGMNRCKSESSIEVYENQTIMSNAASGSFLCEVSVS